MKNSACISLTFNLQYLNIIIKVITKWQVILYNFDKHCAKKK